MRVGLLGAGGPAGVNVARALHHGGHEVSAYDARQDHLRWAEPYADITQDVQDIDVWMAQPDSLALELAHQSVTKLMPSPQTVLLCQDKFECGLAWRRAGLRRKPILLLEDLNAAAGLQFPFWLRARWGAGAKAAICARDAYEAFHWVTFWKQRDPTIEFVAEEFLPGRDYSWCGVYYKGVCRASFARERLEYLYPHLTPEGLTGTPTRAVIIRNAEVEFMAKEAVDAINEKPHGVYCVDLREDEGGYPRPTEINAGRFSTTVGLWSIYSERSNFVALAAELALGDQTRLEDWQNLPEGLELSRHIDCGHTFSESTVYA